MLKKILFASSLIATLLYVVAWRNTDEGMWLLNSLPMDAMKAKGLKLSADEIFSPTSPSLNDAIVQLSFGGGYGTGSFVSARGLIMTNHHVGYSAIQSLSSVQQDYLSDGYLANTAEEELHVEGYTASMYKDINDVTADILSAVNDTMTAEDRLKAIEEKSREVEKEWKEKSKLDCRVTEMYSGLKYYALTYERLTDIRLVYAPPSAIGNYGGEVDNWIWPRHTGDFSIFRAYVGPDGKPAKYSKENVPFKPVKYLPISSEGVHDGSFVMVMGYPGRTYRYRETYSIELAQEETLPMTVDLYKVRMDILEKAGKKDRAVDIKVANKFRRLANTYKHSAGMLEGMRKYGLLQWKRGLESEFTKWLASNPEMEKKYGDVLPKIGEAYGELRAYNKKQQVMVNILGGSDVLRIAMRFLAIAQANKDQQPTEGQISNLREFAREVHKDAHIASDKEILTALLMKAAELPAGQKIAPVEKITQGKTGVKKAEEIRDFVDDLYSDSRLTSLEGCIVLAGEKPGKIEKDAIVRFAQELDTENKQIAERTNRFNATILALRNRLMQGWSQWKGHLDYPDANRTLRLTYGTVKGFNPRDAVSYSWVTKLGGVIEKETGEDPFIVPPKLKELYEKKDFGSYADPKLGDVPVCFIADLDVTGGNSGSPVINGNGEFVGSSFDGNWEAITGDYRFDPPLNLTINVESRYILFILDKFAGAKNILNELEIHGGIAGSTSR